VNKQKKKGEEGRPSFSNELIARVREKKGEKGGEGFEERKGERRRRQGRGTRLGSRRSLTLLFGERQGRRTGEGEAEEGGGSDRVEWDKLGGSGERFGRG